LRDNIVIANANHSHEGGPFLKSRLALCLCVLLPVILLISACGNETGINRSEDDTFHIVTSFYPMYVFTANITQDIDGVSVENMTEPQTGCLHDYELSPADMKILEKANLFVINGADMESFMDEVKKAYPNLPVIEASAGITLIKDAEGEDNPHVWVGISGAIAEVKNISQGLAKADPDHGQQYAANADAYLKKLEDQKEKMHNALKEITHRDIITFHEAFPYFAQEFNLNIAAVIEREPGTEPTATELAETIEIIKARDVTALFVEPQYATKAAETLAAETGIGIYTLDPFVTGPKKADPESYIKTMDENLNTLLEALK
jgi:zinc transport system substrate-binding protein